MYFQPSFYVKNCQLLVQMRKLQVLKTQNTLKKTQKKFLIFVVIKNASFYHSRSENLVIPGTESTDDSGTVLTVIRNLDAPASYEFRTRCVARRDGETIGYGEYSYAVQADIPDADEVPFTVDSFKAIPISPNQIKLEWEVPDRTDINLQGFLIRYFTIDEKSSNRPTLREIRLGKLFSYTLDELEEWTEFTIQMFAQGQALGTSDSSTIIKIQTLPDKPGKKVNFSVKQVNRDLPSLTVDFKLPERSSWNGDLQELKISYASLETGDRAEKSVTLSGDVKAGLSGSVVLEDLVAGESYAGGF